MFGFSQKQLLIVLALLVVVAKYAQSHTVPLIGTPRAPVV